MQPRTRRGSTTTSPGASASLLRVAQDSPPDQTDDLTPAKADDGARETRDAHERIYRIEGLRDVHDGAIRQEDEQIEENFRRDRYGGKEIDGDGE